MLSDNLTDQAADFVLTCNDEALKKLTVSALAGMFRVDRSHLAREFKACKNYTISKFIQKEKMARAALALLLKDANALSVEKLSERLGFCSAEYFRVVFKRHFTVPPSKYRKYKNNRIR